MLYYDINGFERYEINVKQQVRNKNSKRFLKVDDYGRVRIINDSHMELKLQTKELLELSEISVDGPRHTVINRPEFEVDTKGNLWFKTHPSRQLVPNEIYTHDRIRNMGLHAWCMAFHPGLQSTADRSPLFIVTDGTPTINQVRIIHPAIYNPEFILTAFNNFIKGKFATAGGDRNCVYEIKNGAMVETTLEVPDDIWECSSEVQLCFHLQFNGEILRVPESRLDIDLFELKQLLCENKNKLSKGLKCYTMI